RRLDGVRVRYAPDGAELFSQASALPGRHLADTTRGTTRTITETRRELGTERENEELEVGARLQELMVLARLEQNELTGAEGKHVGADPELGAPANHQIDFRLCVEMPRPSIRGLMAPCLGPHPGPHRERLEERRLRARHGRVQRSIVPE